jgi:hypothetical protein
MNADDKRTMRMAKDGLLEPHDYMHLLRPPRPKRQRKLSIRRMVAAAEKAGKPVTNITMPDGTVLHFGASAPTEAGNPWLADLDRMTKK